MTNKDSSSNSRCSLQSKLSDFHLPPHLMAKEMENKFISQLIKQDSEVRKASRLWRFFEIMILIVCGLLSSLAYPHYNVSFLGWISLVPLIIFSLNVRKRRAFLNGFCWGYAWAVTSFYWLREIEPFVPFLMAAVLAFFPAFWSMVVPIFYRAIMIPVSIRKQGFDAIQLCLSKPSYWRTLLFFLITSAAWVVSEWVRTWIFTGLPWNTLATTQWQNISVIQIAEYTGFYGVSFLVILGNFAILGILQAFYRFYRTGKYCHAYPSMTLLFIICVVVIGTSQKINQYTLPNPSQLSNNGQFVTCNMGVVQSIIPMSRGASTMTVERIFDSFAKQSLILGVGKKCDVIIWPESAIPIPYSYYANYLAKIIKRINTPFFIGGTEHPSSKITYNSALLIDENGQMIDSYQKCHRVPFGEFIPFGEIFDKWFPDLRRRFLLPSDLTPGTHFNPIEITPHIKVGTSICFEDVFPYVSRNHAKNGANLLLTITNDAWYPKSNERAQHLANAIFRCIENRLPMVRTGNLMTATVIDPLGQIVQFIPNPSSNGKFDPMDAFKSQSIFQIVTPRLTPKTFYTQYGDVFSYVCLFIASFTLIYSAWQWKTIKNLTNNTQIDKNKED